jgi:hypothetical protein
LEQKKEIDFSFDVVKNEIESNDKLLPTIHIENISYGEDHFLRTLINSGLLHPDESPFFSEEVELVPKIHCKGVERRQLVSFFGLGFVLFGIHQQTGYLLTFLFLIIYLLCFKKLFKDIVIPPFL